MIESPELTCECGAAFKIIYDHSFGSVEFCPFCGEASVDDDDLDDEE